MRAFLSHASADKQLVLAVHDALEPLTTWLDRAELELGDLFLEKIEDGIRNASDFVLFWSKASAASEFVRLEVHMAFIQSLESRAIRLRVIRLDDTPLPLRLKPFQYLSVVDSSDPVSEIVDALQTALAQPTRGVRHRFLDRNSELGRIEELINDAETRLVLLRGFQGIGKGSLAHEALRRFFDGASVVEVTAGPSVGPSELALQLHQAAHGTVLGEVSGVQALAAVESALTTIVARGQFIVLRNVHHWLDGEREVEEPLGTVIKQAALHSETRRQPIFLTSTRVPRVSPDASQYLSTVQVQGLPDDHMSSLVSMWFELTQGSSLPPEQGRSVASLLHGHPIAAKVASTLIAQFGAEHLEQYPRELVALQRDLAKTMIGDLQLSVAAQKLLEVLSLIAVPVPSRVLVDASGFDEETFQDAVAGATGAGLAEVTDTGHLAIHPLVADYFWRSHLDSEDYRERAGVAGQALEEHLATIPTSSATFVGLLPVAVRLFALSGDMARAYRIRGDLVGELSQAAITHYNRRQYALAEAFIEQILVAEPQSWRMRLYLARIRIRQRRWGDADSLIEALMAERPHDIGIQHVRGWRLLRGERFEEALQVFLTILIQREKHVASLRDAADCLYSLGRAPEALEFLDRAKRVESDNAFVLDLEARIYQELGDYERALTAANLAVIRSPASWALRHRRAQILSSSGRRQEALAEAQEAVNLDPEQFTARSTLVSLLLDTGARDEAREQLSALQDRAVNGREKQVVDHLAARGLYLAGDLDAALEMVEGQIRRRRNLAPSYGLLVQIRLEQYSRLADRSTASAALLLQQAKRGLADCEAQPDHDPGIVEQLRRRIANLEASK
ncbi:MAG: TIR domain-containing protein [Acidobacteria bacterium]|nr:TIR domain-containing protein [Acidobacteriota bacterium]